MSIAINGNGITSANIADGAITNADISSSAAIDASKLVGTGKVLQVLQVVKSDTFSTTVQDNTFAAITGLSISITPTSTTSKILVTVEIGNIMQTDTNGRHTNFRINRDGTAIGLGDASGSKTRATFSGGSFAVHYGNSASASYLDSPASTSALSYSVSMAGHTGGTHRINGRATGENDNADAPNARLISTITVMEIGA